MNEVLQLLRSGNNSFHAHASPNTLASNNTCNPTTTEAQPQAAGCQSPLTEEIFVQGVEAEAMSSCNQAEQVTFQQQLVEQCMENRLPPSNRKQKNASRILLEYSKAESNNTLPVVLVPPQQEAVSTLTEVSAELVWREPTLDSDLRVSKPQFQEVPKPPESDCLHTQPCNSQVHEPSTRKISPCLVDGDGVPDMLNFNNSDSDVQSDKRGSIQVSSLNHDKPRDEPYMHEQAPIQLRSA